MADTTNASLAGLAALVGEWTTEATHPMFPGTVVRGTASFAWFEGDKFLILKATTDHPDFPDSIAIIGDTSRDRIAHDAPSATGKSGKPAVDRGDGGGLRMFYFDERGVHRVFDVRISAEAWEFSRDAPGFSQRFTGTFADGGNTIAGLSQLSRDGRTWADDLKITYRRRGAR